MTCLVSETDFGTRAHRATGVVVYARNGGPKLFEDTKNTMLSQVQIFGRMQLPRVSFLPLTPVILR